MKNESDLKYMQLKEQHRLFDEKYKGQTRTFRWFMEHLLPPKKKYKGCEILFCDTVFYSEGKPSVIMRSDADFCLTKEANPYKLV